MVIQLDTFPGSGLESTQSSAERALTRDFFEHAVILAVEMGDKDSFQKYISSLRPYYNMDR
jgi:hypothetical protein